MMRGLFFGSMLVYLIGIGFAAPFVFGLAYIWADLFSPQRVVYSPIVNAIPFSLIAALGSVVAYTLSDRRSPPKFTVLAMLIVIWAMWMTLTTTWAEVPQPAWQKWDWAVKSVAFAAFLPFLFRSRVQIEAMLLTIIFSIAGNWVAAAPKTVKSGGGYGFNLGLLQGNFGLAEGSTLAAVSVALVPLLLYCAHYSKILPWPRLARWMFYGLILGAVITAIGTYARTGLVSLAVLGAYMWWQTKRKITYLIVVAALSAAIGTQVTTDGWKSRMNTISEYDSEGSALGRIAVWMWTLDYVRSHPLGGGFDVYRINHQSVEIAGSSKTLDVQGKAFHSIYFETLGEQGVPGFAIFISINGMVFLYARRVRRATKGIDDLRWAHELARAISVTLLVTMIGGAFVGIAYQSLIYYIAAMTISLDQYVKKVRAPRIDKPELMHRPQYRDAAA